MQGKKVVFAFDMRIEKRVLKLQVFEDDSLEDLISRFSKAANLSQRFHDKIKGKLEAQLKSFTSKKICTEKIKNKIEEFLEESKIFIIGVSETEVYFPQFAQTPLRMLDQTFNQNISSAEKKTSSMAKVSPVISKYVPKEIYVEQEEDKRWSDPKKQAFANRQLISYNSQASIKNGFRKNSYENRFYNSKQKLRPPSHSNYQTYKLQISQKGSLEKRQESKESLKRTAYYGQENLIPSKAKQNHLNMLQTKLNYNNCSEARGAAWGFKQARKFNYLYEANF